MRSDKDIQDEFSLIEQLASVFQSYQSQTIVPNGDDAAIYKANKGKGQIVCVDTIVEDIHFKRTTMSPFQIGYKSLAVNLSDIAAMGGIPTYFLVSLAVSSSEWRKEELTEVYQGMKVLADQWKIDLLGGDMVSANSGLTISVTAIGEGHESVKLLRSNAQPGHLLFVTGYLGESAAGLDYLLHQELRNSQFSEQEKEEIIAPLVLAHQRPLPHIRQGQLLAEYALEHSIALNDVSDGLASEAYEIASSSNINIIIEKEKLPLSKALHTYATQTEQSPYDWVFNGGEDFVLVGTMPASIVDQVKKSFQAQNLSFYSIGYVQKGNGEVWIRENNKLFPVHKTGYNHFTQLKE